MEKYKKGVGIAAGCLMLKWNIMDAYMHRDNRIDGNSKINLFINLESILRNVTMKYDINDSIQFFKQDVVLELESGILNLIANYRSYFNKEGCQDVKVYLYYTSLNDTKQKMKEYNKSYRNFYRNKYTQNPKSSFVGSLFTEIIVPELKMILNYIPNCYLIETTDIDSSVVPLIIAEKDKSYTNIILSSDVFDSLYLFEKNFITLYIKRRFSNFKIISDVESAVQSIIVDEDIYQLSILYEEMYYKLLLSIKGSRIRNIKSAKGFGYMKFVKIINDAINSGRILKDFKSIDSIIDIFPEKYRNDIKLAFLCTDIRFQYSLLTNSDKETVFNQIIDLEDRVSVESLNNVRFHDYNINIQGLLL